MASLSITLDARRPNRDGDYPVKFVINAGKTNASIPINISLPIKSWLGNGFERPIKTSHPGAKLINDQIQALYIEFRKRISDLELSGWTKNAKASDIKKRILDDRSVVQPAEILFSDYAEQYVESCKSSGTGRNYAHTLTKLSAFLNKENIRFEDITFQTLKDFDSHLQKSGSGINTRSIHFRNIRAVFNRAIDNEVIKQETYPFRKFKIKSEEKDKVSLSPYQVKKLYEYDLSTPALRMARDFWMMSFFFCGINPIDLYHLIKPDSEGRISFIRTKEKGSNHITLRLLIQPETQEIINRYKNDDDSPYLQNFVDKYVNYENFRSFLGKKIREIAMITGLAGLTMYHARYSGQP